MRNDIIFKGEDRHIQRVMDCIKTISWSWFLLIQLKLIPLALLGPRSEGSNF